MVTVEVFDPASTQVRVSVGTLAILPEGFSWFSPQANIRVVPRLGQDGISVRPLLFIYHLTSQMYIVSILKPC
jgi:hypothetical protein